MRKLTLITATLILTLSVAANADREFKFDKSDQVDGNIIVEIKIDIPSGDIEILNSTSGNIEIEYRNVVYARDQEEADKINDDYNFSSETRENKLLITVERPKHRRRGRNVLDKLFSGDWNNNANTYLRLRVPDGKTVEVKTSSADLNVTGIKADLDIRGSSSDLVIRDTEGNFYADLSSGDVDISDHKGDIQITGNSSDIGLENIKGSVSSRTSSGDGYYTGISGSVDIEASSGDFRLTDIGGDLEAVSSSGDIYAHGVAGSIQAKSSSGDMRLKQLSSRDGDFNINSVSGDVIMEINPEFEGRISLRSNSGSINSRLSADIDSFSDSRLSGKMGNGSGRLEISTTSGDITIDRY